MDWGLVGKAAPQAINERILVGDATVAFLHDFKCVAINDIECRERDQNVGVEAIDEAAAMENANAPDNYVAVADPDRVSDGDDVALAPAARETVCAISLRSFSPLWNGGGSSNVANALAG